MSPIDRSKVEVPFSDLYEPGKSVPEVIDHRTPLTELLKAEDSGLADGFPGKQRAVNDVLDWIFAAGPHPASVMQRLYSVARRQAPQLLLELPPELMEVVFGDGRDARLERIGLLLKEPNGPRRGWARRVKR